MGPSILAIQELEVNALSEWLETTYEGHHVFKTGKEDGVGIFWDREMFNCIGKYSVRLDQGSGSQVFGKPQVAAIVALDLNSPDQYDLGAKTNEKQALLVCSTHLIFNSNRGDQKLGQLSVMVRAMKEV